MLTRFWHLLLLVQFVQCKNLEVREDVPEMQSSMGKSQVNQEFVRKNPRVFFSTSTVITTSSTVTTSQACYTTANIINTACSKKKRSIIDTNPIPGLIKNPKIIMPATLNALKEEFEEPEIVGYSVKYSREEKSLDLKKLPELNQIADVKVGREEVVKARFVDDFLYWFTTTTTITSTTTSYSATTTFTIDGCTPAGSFSYTACG